MTELDSGSRSLQTLYSWFADGKLSVNRRYQRKLVWTLDEKQKLVESVLKQYPVPAILLAAKEDEGYEIIDGLQRLHTLMSFIETAFVTLGGARFDVSRFPTAQARAEESIFEVQGRDQVLTAREVSTFLDYNMPVSVMKGASETEIDEVFARINTYGHRLSDQERRQAGVEDKFAEMVRDLASSVRGDVSPQILDLGAMPAISIDLPMTRQGYDVVAAEVFWVEQGILRSTDLRDSMDEQCIADIAASIVGGQILDRSKDALDAVYENGSTENARIATALDTHGADKFSAEFRFCIDEIKKICALDQSKKLRSIIFSKSNTNPFPAVFAVLMIALHEALIGGSKQIANYAGVRGALTGLDDRLETSRRSTSPDERRKNVDVVKGLIGQHLVDVEREDLYDDHGITAIDDMLKLSMIELAHYELKQGMLRLDETRSLDDDAVKRVMRTICAIANNGRDRSGLIVVGVSDRPAHTARIVELDNVETRRVGMRDVVGVSREARALNESVEQYVARWRHAIEHSPLSEPLKSDVLSSIAFNDYYGLGVLLIRIPRQEQLSYYGDEVFWRRNDETIAAGGAKKAVELAGRFTVPQAVAESSTT
ncbi:DUF262 domain-containing protein [Microbacterium sp. R86528]|uniref:GmrSD restriction endonuclease domain-containing protein n=1 Tax=Microbacterium sp. R86528 TaxID=3093864 RepID=UPI0037CBC2DB